MLPATWSICALLVIPVILSENIGPIAAFKRSAQLVKNNKRKLMPGKIRTLFFDYPDSHFSRRVQYGTRHHSHRNNHYRHSTPTVIQFICKRHV